MKVFKHMGSAAWYFSVTINKRTYFRSTKTSNKALAERIAFKFKEDKLKEAVFGRERKPITVQDALLGYAESRKTMKVYRGIPSVIRAINGLTTHNATKKLIKTTALDTKKYLHQLDEVDLNQFVEGKRVKDRRKDWTITGYLSVISCGITWAHQSGYLTNPDLKIPVITKAKPKPVFLTKDEEKALLASLDPNEYRHGYGYVQNRSPHRHQRLVDQYDFVVGLLDCGPRYSELARMTWRDVNFDHGTVFLHQTKTGTSLTHAMTKRMSEMLQRRWAERTHDEYVFPNDERDGPRNYSAGWFSRALKRANITKKFGLHKCRSTFASKLVQSGATLFAVQQLLGHQDPKTTMIYASLVPSDNSRAAAAILDKLAAD